MTTYGGSGTYGGGLSSNQAGNATYYGNPDAWNQSKQQASAWGSGSMMNNTLQTAPTAQSANYTGQSATATTPDSVWDWYRSGANNPSTGSGSAATYQNPYAMPAGVQTPQYSTQPARPAGATATPATYSTPFTGYGFGTGESWKAMDPAAVQNFGAFLPWEQLRQNSYQYGMDFNENQRRWDEQFGHTRANDQFNQSLAAQQQAMAQWVAQQQQNNWGQQFGLDSELGRGYLDIGRQNAASEDWYRRGQIGVAQTQNQIDEMYKRGQLSNEQYANESTRMYQQQQVGIAQAANSIDQMWKTGQLDNQQRELALAQLTQAQNEAFRRAQLSQELTLSREQMANQQRIANMQAFGRVQAPNARFVRTWG